MATEVAPLLALAGLILVVAFGASALFRRTYVPDILFLLGLGAVLGPATGVFDIGFIATALPLIAAMAVVLILFDGALEITPSNLRSIGTASAVLSVSIFTGTTLLCGTILHFGLDYAWPLAFLLGMAFGGAGIAIIVPLAQSMGVSSNGLAVIVLEAVISDIMVVMGVSLAATVLVLGGFGWVAMGPLMLAIVVAIIAGLAGGWVWNRVLDRIGSSSSAYMVSLAALFLVYALTEALDGAGPLAVLLFGIMAGRGHRAAMARDQAAGHRLVAFHHEIAFFVRAFFFVFLGAAMDWSLLAQPRFLVAGAALAAAIALTRMVCVGVVLRRTELSARDRMTAAVLFPMGLVTAAVSVIPYRQFEIPGTEHFGDVATVVILLTNILATLFVFGAARSRPA